MVQTIDATALADLIAAGQVDVIDVRDVAEFHSGHVPGARNIVLETLREDPETYLTRGSTIVFVCKKGVRSLAAAKLAERFGYDPVYNLDGGVTEWSRVGMPLVETRVAA
jgi:rhodanese-related sulfurtransferase